MANAFLNMPATTVATAILRRSRSLARLSTSSTGTDFLGASTADRNAELVAIFNDKERGLFNEFPLLGRTSYTSLTTTANQRHTLLPTTTRVTDIMQLKWGDVDDVKYEGVTIPQKTRQFIESLPNEYRQDEYTDEYPEYWTLGLIQYSNQAAIEWYKMPSTTGKSVILEHRTGPTTWVAADLSSGSVVSAIPDDMIDLLCHDIALELQFRGAGIDGNLLGKREELYQRWLGIICQTPQQMREATFSAEYADSSIIGCEID